MRTLEADVEKRKAQLEHWGAKIDLLLAKADEFGATARSAYRRRVEELKAKYQILSAKFGELQAASMERWDALWPDVDNEWRDFENALSQSPT